MIFNCKDFFTFLNDYMGLQLDIYPYLKTYKIKMKASRPPGFFLFKNNSLDDCK